LPSAHLDVVGGHIDEIGRAVLTVGPDQTLEARILVTTSAPELPPSTHIRFTLHDVASGETAGANDHFKAP
jgi:hypothetical protein